jgi:hypothetical protein
MTPSPTDEERRAFNPDACGNSRAACEEFVTDLRTQARIGRGWRDVAFLLIGITLSLVAFWATKVQTMISRTEVNEAIAAHPTVVTMVENQKNMAQIQEHQATAIQEIHDLITDTQLRMGIQPTQFGTAVQGRKH